MSRKFASLVVIILVVIGVAVGMSFWKMPKIEKENYQGVVLRNGVAYFGHLDYGDKYMALTDVYYLQQGQQTLDLIKFGTEPQGPQDRMNINKNEVMYWYNLNKEGELYKKIMIMKGQK